MKPNNKLTSLFADNPLLAIGAVILPVMLILIVVLSFATPKKSPNPGEYVAPDTAAFLIYKASPYLPLSSTIANNLLREDMAYYARQTMTEYNPAKQPSVAFTLSSSPVETATTLQFEGKYEKNGSKITVIVTKLNNDRIKTSITNAKSKANLDDKLPSHTKLNTFIASLPYFNQHYLISYVRSNGSISVTIPEQEPSFLAEAQAYLRTQLGVSDTELKKLNIGYSYPTNVDYGNTLVPKLDTN